MVINTRYFILTIISIFLALGIGIFIGFSFDAQEIVGKQREDIISQLEERFNYLREENENNKREIQQLNVEVEKYRKFSSNVYPELIRNRLDGINIAIIETNDDYIYPYIDKVLEMAGANVISTTTIKDKFITDREEITRLGIELFGENEGDKIEKIIEELTKAIITGKNIDIIQLLNQKGIIEIFGDYTLNADYMIIAGGSNEVEEERLNIIDRKIIDYTKRVNIPIIGIEGETVKYSYIDEYKKARISTVDNVDSIIGQVSLVLAMDGMPGNYGVKESAEVLMPTLYNRFE